MTSLPLRDGDIELRRFDPADFPLAWAWFQPFWPRVSDDFGPETLAQFVALKQAQAREGREFGCVLRAGEMGGLFELQPLSPHLCEVHAGFKKAFWGRETTLPALRLGIIYCWSQGFRKISAPVYMSNRAMGNLLEKLDFVREGVLHSHTIQRGVEKDVALYALFRR